MKWLPWALLKARSRRPKGGAVMWTPTAGSHRGPVACHHSSRLRALLIAPCALARLLGLASFIWGQAPNAFKTVTPIDDRLHDHLLEVQDSAMEFWLERAADPSLTKLGKTITFENLQRATWRRDYSATTVRLVNDLFLDATANTFEARAVVSHLETQLLQAQHALDFAKNHGSSMPVGGGESHFQLAQSASSRVSNIESRLAMARLNLIEASLYQYYWGAELRLVKSDLQKAEVALTSVQRGAFYFNEIAPRVDVTVNFAAEQVPVVFIARDAFDLITNPVYQLQTADAASTAGDLLLNILSYLQPDTFVGDQLLPGFSSFDQTMNGFRRSYNGFEHQKEARNLAFGGTLSQLNLNKVPNYEPAANFHDHEGTFFIGAANGPLAVYSRWTSEEGLTTASFNAQSWYRFHGLETASGHIMTGFGKAGRERVERHSPFEFSPILNVLSLFDFGDSFNEVQTSWRYESYNDSFNGALANQSIQRFEREDSHSESPVAPTAGLPNLENSPSLVDAVLQVNWSEVLALLREAVSQGSSAIVKWLFANAALYTGDITTAANGFSQLGMEPTVSTANAGQNRSFLFAAKTQSACCCRETLLSAMAST